jgi:hypothetical protein
MALSLQLQLNQLCWLPFDLDRLPATTIVLVSCFLCASVLHRCLTHPQLSGNPLPLSFHQGENARSHFLDLFAATTHIGMIRERATAVCNALHDLELPALLSLEIIDALCPNSIRMWAKWELITAVKHFHERHEEHD